jgi:two-component system, NarL family, invasion response regulator UvrY
MIRVVIADDHPIVREGLQRILEKESDIRIVGEAASGGEVLPVARSQAADVVILDISMPGGGGIEALGALRRELPAVQVLMLSMYPERQYAVRCLKAGASGYLTKDTVQTELVAALRKVVQGRRYVSESLAERLAGDLDTASVKAPHDTLSEREYQVMMSFARGLTVSRIAEELSLSVPTVNTYRSRILAKLHLSTTAEIMHYAFTHHLIEGS